MALLCRAAGMQLLAHSRHFAAAAAAAAHAAAAVPRVALPGAAGARQQRRTMTTDAVEPATAAAPTVGNNGRPPYFASFQIYKKQGALTVKPLTPRWGQTPGGAHQLDAPGGLMFEFAPAAAGTGTAPGTRRYSWDQKISIAMSPLELAAICRDPAAEHQFYHDTFKGQAGREGSMTKTLKWSMAPDGGAFFLNATSNEAGVKKMASVSMSPDELWSLQSLVAGCMPLFFGFPQAFASWQP